MEKQTLVKTREEMQKFVEQLCLDTGQSEKTEWRRASWRCVCTASSTVGLEESRPPSQSIDAIMCNISGDGAGFLTHGKLAPDQRILLAIEAGQKRIEVPATVEHVTRTLSDTFRVGVGFDFEDA